MHAQLIQKEVKKKCSSRAANNRIFIWRDRGKSRNNPILSGRSCTKVSDFDSAGKRGSRYASEIGDDFILLATIKIMPVYQRLAAGHIVLTCICAQRGFLQKEAQ
ncbi:hypothetical protein TNCV_1078881 [Trichonephila clavipes]|nr:hypothetical protein TNCV_1078881 [Trichonephila clavipes]